MTPTPASPPARIEISYRLADVDGPCRGPLTQALVAPLRSVQPMRRIVSYYGERRHPSLYWCSKREDHLACESRHEEHHLQLLDFDQDVVWVSAQPLMLHFETSEGWTEHVPDFLVWRADGTRELIDVTVAERFSEGLPASYGWTAEACRRLAWDYRVRDAIDPVLQANVMLIAAAKRPLFGESLYADKILDAARLPLPWVEVEAAVGPVSAVRPIMLRLVWQDRLACDLSEFLDEDTVVVARPKLGAPR